jgi:FkbM family methyltransferase
MKKIVLSSAATVARILPPSLKRLLYKLGPLTRWLRQILNKASPSGATEIKIAAGRLAGMRMLLDMQDEKDLWLGTYESEILDSLSSLVKPGMVVYDIGANVGYLSLLFARLCQPGGQVIAFEPVPENAERIEHNAALNRYQDTILVEPLAVIDAARRLRFYVPAAGGTGKVEGAAGRREGAYVREIEVQGISLDEYCVPDCHPAPDLIKIDIEGGEILAIPGMKHLLARIRPTVVLELHGPEAAEIAWRILKASGYRICYLKPGYPQVLTFEELDWMGHVVAFAN